ncbi:MAG: hypothetical protein L6Q54_06375 [Leptospiraceae bacterium]|nr:hypothetical protein [Leptospiraceae bacterium]MCK6380862.1 hypothetical protein [Leptospiraceae bacterium]
MNRSKREKVRHAFMVTHTVELRNERLNPSGVFDICWARIPEALTKKLNANELLEYINLHILPKVVTEEKSVQCNVFPKSYKMSNLKKHTLEVFA